MHLVIFFIIMYLPSDGDIGRRPNFPEKDPRMTWGGDAGEGVYVLQWICGARYSPESLTRLENPGSP